MSVPIAIAAVALLVSGWLSVTAAHAAQSTPSPGLHFGSPIPEESAALMTVTKGIICRCGCGLSVYECQNTMPCSVAPRMRDEAKAKLAAGMTPQQALDSFAADYGSQVLAAPTKTGFNLTAWILPFVFLGAGLVLIVFALLKWRPAPALEGEEQTPVVDEKYEAAVEEELKREM